LLTFGPDNAAVGADEGVDDDRLRLIFTCCHPALAQEGRLALTLREVCGLTTEEIARAFGRLSGSHCGAMWDCPACTIDLACYVSRMDVNSASKYVCSTFFWIPCG
jgi:hypothetical protein